MSRERVAELRRRLELERERLRGLRRELTSLPPAPGRRHGWVIPALALGIAGTAGWWLAPREPAPSASVELLARRDALQANHALEKQKVEATAVVAPAPVKDPDAGVRAWAKIGRAACTVGRAELARVAYKKLDFEGAQSRRGSDDGTMRPEISEAIRTLDRECRERGIHVLVP
ncbi:MAG: hypothetical protein IPM35_27545 [Myxococcales bacterium]|nr:hypothetical protein [Myxococcales bacterium]